MSDTEIQIPLTKKKRKASEKTKKKHSSESLCEVKDVTPHQFEAALSDEGSPRLVGLTKKRLAFALEYNLIRSSNLTDQTSDQCELIGFTDLVKVVYCFLVTDGFLQHEDKQESEE